MKQVELFVTIIFFSLAIGFILIITMNHYARVGITLGVEANIEKLIANRDSKWEAMIKNRELCTNLREDYLEAEELIELYEKGF